MKRIASLAMAVCLLLAATVGTHAQTVKTIYSFGNCPQWPVGGLRLAADGNFYDVSTYGGGGFVFGPNIGLGAPLSTGGGTVYRITTNGVWTVLASFTGTNGLYPYTPLTQGPDGNFYGTTSQGGSYGYGTLFKVTINGVLTTLLNFDNTNVLAPADVLVFSLVSGPDGNMYGTTGIGGSSGYGSVFQLTTNGSFTTLASFTSTNNKSPMSLTLARDGNFYGITSGSNYGSIFRVTTNGTLTLVVNFNGTNGYQPQGFTVGPDGNLYGTTINSSTNFNYSTNSITGTVFQFNLQNDALTTLVTFTGTAQEYPSRLTLGPDGNFYGQFYQNTMFKVTTNGVFTLVGTLSEFGGNGWVVGPDGCFYALTDNGVQFGGGYSYSFGNMVRVTTNATATTVGNFFGLGGTVPQSLTLGPDGNFYGTENVYNTILQITTNGMVNTLATFNGTNGSGPSGLTTGPDGGLYGTAGSSGVGYPLESEDSVFKVSTGGVITLLATFNANTNGGDVDFPYDGGEELFETSLARGPDGSFYGTSLYGGSDNEGTIFRVTTNGVLSTLVNFNTTNGLDASGLTVGPDGNFYGTTQKGGAYDYGSVFRVTTNGVLTTLYSFLDASSGGPTAGLTLGPDGNLYGIIGAFADMNYNYYADGAVFKISTNGTFQIVSVLNHTLSTYSPMVFGPDGSLYGTTFGDYWGPGPDFGSVFKVSTNGTVSTLITFNYTNNGAYPLGGLTLGPDGNFYGTTTAGGIAGGGTVFQLQLPPDFTSPPANQTVIIGNRATFNSQPFGTGPFTFQWLSNGIPILGATNASLTISPVLASEAGAFQVQVLNNSGSITSQPVSMNVVQQPNNYGVTASSGNCTVYLASYPQSTNRLWASTDLIRWQVIATNLTDANGLSQYQDTNTTGLPHKYYRLSNP